MCLSAIELILARIVSESYRWARETRMAESAIRVPLAQIASHRFTKNGTV